MFAWEELARGSQTGTIPGAFLEVVVVGGQSSLRT